MKKVVGFWALCLVICHATFSQVDTTFIYNTSTPYGTLDIRIAKSSTRYYYLQENKTFSFRESAPGVKTGTYRDMTSWDSSPYTQGNLREKNGSADYFALNYRLLFPSGYNSSYSEGYPLVIMMHGAGERGNCWDDNCNWATRSWRPGSNNPAAPTTSSHPLLNNDYNLLHGGSIHLQARNLAGTRLPNDPAMPSRAFPGFVLFPQNLNGWDTGHIQDALRLVRLIVKKYKIDPNRIYIHGLSAGGIGVYEMIKRAPWMFAAALPMSAPHDAGIISSGMSGRISSIPLWIFQGGQDTAPSPGRTRGYVKNFTNAGLTVRYNEYAHLGHGVWNTAYKEQEFFSWMLNQNKSKIHVFGDVAAICRTNGQGVRMALAEGFYAYQWERNGVIISGATAATYVANTTGIYRARFSRKKNPGPSDWNKWSDPVTVTENNPVQAQVEQVGTLMLKDLNNFAEAKLKAVGEYENYWWYKDGVRLDVYGTMDDTVSHVTFKSGDCSTGPCAGNGMYTLVVAGRDRCPSPASDGRYIYFNNQAPTNITAPTTFTGTPITDGRVNLSWTDASTNETGFEVWRRRQTGSTSFTKWELATITSANIKALTDRGLYPSSTYQYKIRAVSNAGRSNYTPSASNAFLIVKTLGDSASPSVPQNLTGTSTAIQEVTLKWQASSDNIDVKEYNIYYGTQVVSTGSKVTTYKITGLELNRNYTFTVRAKDLGNNLSAASNAVTVSTVVNGLYYEHSTGAWTDLDNINWSFAEFVGTAPNFTLTPRTQEDFFNFEFEGFLYIQNGGQYQFQTTSDDGSRLAINGTVSVENDGRHGNKTITGALQTLNAGAQKINVKYFDYDGGQSLTVRYKGPDTGESWITIPNSALTSGSTTSATMIMASADSTDINARTTTEETKTKLSADIYPNPVTTQDDISVQLSDKLDQSVKVQLIDMMGTSYYEQVFDISEVSTGNIRIKPNQMLKQGMYIMIINQGETTVKQRVIVKE